MLDRLLKNISTEAVAIENEVEVFVKTTNVDQFKALATIKTYQEQYSFKVDKTEDNTSDSRHRIRYSIEEVAGAELDRSYIYCIKMLNEDGTDTEIEFPVDELVYRHFKLTAQRRMIKIRYTIPTLLTGVEVDVFVNGKSPWVKVDIELDAKSIVSDELVKQILTTFKSTFTDIEEIIVVTPLDRVSGTKDYKLTRKFMDQYAVELGPFIKES